MVLEFSHQCVLSIWIGTLVAIASLAVPSLIDSMADPLHGARIILDLLARVSFLGCGAGSFLLLTTLLMHLLSIRGARGALVQAALILGMTLIATALQVWLAPAVSGLLRSHTDLFTAGPSAELTRFRSLLTLYLVLQLLQALLGIAQLLLGIRRWYRYESIRILRTYGS
jgi:hypothetical protein